MLALVKMRGICYLLPFRTAALKVSSIIVVAHHQPIRAVTLVGGLVEDVAILTVTLTSNLVKPGTRRTVGRGRWPGGVRGMSGCLGSIGGCCGSIGGCLVRALVEMRSIVHILSVRAGALKVSFSVVVSHFQPLGAVTLVGRLVEDVAILTVTLSSNLVKPGTRRAVGRGRWPGGVRGMSGCLGSIGGCCGSIGGCLVRALVEMRSVVHILSVRAGALKVSFSIIVSHFQPLGALTLVGCPVNHVAVLTVAFLSILVQCGASWALVRHIGCRVGGCLGRVGSCRGRLGGCCGGVGGCCGSVGWCITGIGALVEMKTQLQIVSIRAGTLKVSFSVVVSHFQPVGAVTLVGCPVNHVAVLTVAFLSILVQCGASWALVRHIGCRVGGCLGRVGGCFGSVGGCCSSLGGCFGSVGGCRGSSGWCITGVGALIEMRSIAHILSIRAGALKVSFSVVVSHFQPLGAVTLVGCPVNHVAVLTVTFLSYVIQSGASGAVVIRSGLGVGN